MWKKIRPLLILLSVALNVAFVTFWAVRALPSHFCGKRGTTGGGAVWCPLHRKLGTTDAQWREIEPRLAEFKKSARTVCTFCVLTQIPATSCGSAGFGPPVARQHTTALPVPRRRRPATAGMFMHSTRPTT